MAYLHAQASVFRAVEFRRPVIRAGNTGLSGFIDPHGRLLATVQDPDGTELFVTGTRTENVPLLVESFTSQRPQDTWITTGFARWGDAFAWGCFGAVLVVCFVDNRRARHYNPK